MLRELNLGGFVNENTVVTIYNFDAENREFKTSSVEELVEGTGIPAFSCTDEPITTDTPNTCVVRNHDNSEWIIIPDYRNSYVYNKDNSKIKTLIEKLSDYDESIHTHIEPENDYSYFDDNSQKWISCNDLKNDFYTSINKTLKDDLLHEIEKDTDMLWKELQLDMISDVDKEYLKKCMSYIKYLNALDLSNDNLIFDELPKREV